MKQYIKTKNYKFKFQIIGDRIALSFAPIDKYGYLHRYANYVFMKWIECKTMDLVELFENIPAELL